MPADPNNKPRRISLPVLPHSGKVDQLRSDPPLPIEPAAPSPAYTPHVNIVRPATHLTPQQQALQEKVIAALRTVYDPEIPVNLYDLGLIYDIDIDPDNTVRIRMTLTAPGCPVADLIPTQVQTAVESIPEVKSATVDLVWEPTWTKEMMSEVARLDLGL
jgi:FeS assembly SUF system protein